MPVFMYPSMQMKYKCRERAAVYERAREIEYDTEKTSEKLHEREWGKTRVRQSLVQSCEK